MKRLFAFSFIFFIVGFQPVLAMNSSKHKRSCCVRQAKELWTSFVKCLYSTNFHKVTKNLYRSGAMTREELIEVIEKYKIKEIVTLTKKDCGLKERVAKEKDIPISFVSLSANSVPKREDIENVVEVLKGIKQPTLFCGRGCGANVPANVMALYYLYVAEELSDNKRLQLALEQFSYKKYGYCVIYHKTFSDGGINFIEKLGKDCPRFEDLSSSYDIIAKGKI